MNPLMNFLRRNWYWVVIVVLIAGIWPKYFFWPLAFSSGKIRDFLFWLPGLIFIVLAAGWIFWQDRQISWSRLAIRNEMNRRYPPKPEMSERKIVVKETTTQPGGVQTLPNLNSATTPPGIKMTPGRGDELAKENWKELEETRQLGLARQLVPLALIAISHFLQHPLIAGLAGFALALYLIKKGRITPESSVYALIAITMIVIGVSLVFLPAVRFGLFFLIFIGSPFWYAERLEKYRNYFPSRPCTIALGLLGVFLISGIYESAYWVDTGSATSAVQTAANHLAKAKNWWYCSFMALIAWAITFALGHQEDLLKWIKESLKKGATGAVKEAGTSWLSRTLTSIIGSGISERIFGKK